MAISGVAIASFEQVAQTRVSVNQDTEKTQQGGQASQVDVSQTVEERREAKNMSILQANYSVSLNSKDNPSSVLFKRAIDAINKELEPTLGKNAAQKAYDEGIDFSPQATADRIVSFATSFFPLYQQQHGDKSLEDQLDSFLDVVGGGAEKGFGEAKDILTGLDVFNGDVEKNANETYDLIFAGFAKFKDTLLEASKPSEPVDEVEQAAQDPE